MAKFRDVLSDCKLFDLGFRGPKWTYDNKQSGVDNVKVRIDRGVADQGWSSIFVSLNRTHLFIKFRSPSSSSQIWAEERVETPEQSLSI